MIQPIISYGFNVLRMSCKDITPEYPDLEKIVTELTETLDATNGIGLAASQVNHAIKLFIVNTKQVFEKMTTEQKAAYFLNDIGIKEVFMNAKITKSSREVYRSPEGCLSLPTISEEIERKWIIEVEYLNRDFTKKTKTFSGLTAKVIQHEIDHTEGILFIEHLPPLKKKLLASRLKQILEGKIDTEYKMKFIGG